MDRGAWQETEHTYTHETSLVVQWLRLHASKAGDVGSIAGRGNEIPHAMRWDKKKKMSGLSWIQGLSHVPRPLHRRTS